MTTVDDVAANGLRERVTRMRLYVGQMFPLPMMLVTAACHFFAIWFALQALTGTDPVRPTWVALRGTATVLLFLLLMRLYDELKDAPTDIALGRAGDPLYRDRVLVTGAVKLEDVHWLRWLVTAALVVINLQPRVTWASIAFWLLFGVAWLSFNWFFWPRMSRYLLVAFVTHNPIALLLDLYVAALFIDRFGGALPAPVALLLVGLWLPMAVWETSRKIRAPQDETTYQTYSRVLGWRAAAYLPAVFAVGSATLLIMVARAAGLGAAFPVVVAAACGIVVLRCAMFRIAPSRHNANLKPWAMGFAIAANAGLALAIVANRGVTW